MKMLTDITNHVFLDSPPNRESLGKERMTIAAAGVSVVQGSLFFTKNGVGC